MRLRDTPEAHYTGVWAAERRERQIRRHHARVYRLRDRYHGKVFKLYEMLGHYAWLRRFEPDYTFNRRQCPTDTGYGRAYENRPDKDIFR